MAMRKDDDHVDAHASKSHRQDVARRPGITGRPRVRKGELVEAITQANRRETAASRTG
jgi:hypothetical protein